MSKEDFKIHVRAYEKSKPKTALSEFVNDLGFVDKDTLNDLFDQFRDWIIDTFAGNKGGVPTGNLNGGNVAFRAEAAVNNVINCENAIYRPTAKIRLYGYGGDIKHRKDIADGTD